MSQQPDLPPQPPPGVEIAPGVFAHEDDLRLRYSRSGGPGGQNVNKVNTKCDLWMPVGAIRGLTERVVLRLRHLAGSRLTQDDEIHIAASTHRTQEQNRQAALDILRDLIVRARVEPKVRRKTKPSASSKRKRIDEKRRRGEIKSLRRRGVD